MFNIFNEILSESSIDNDYISISGTYTYHIKPQVKGTLPFSNTTLMIQAFPSKTSPTPLKLKCRWYREIGSRNYEITDNKDETYHINAQDIGCFVKVAIRPKSKKYSKKDIAIVRFGPFQMSETLSLNLEKDLTNGVHVYQFGLLKHNSQFVNDQSDFQNFLKVDNTGISVQFGFYFELFENFFLLHNSAHPYRIVCEVHDYTVLSIFYKKGCEVSLSEDILKDFPKLKKKYKILKEKFLRETINENTISDPRNNNSGLSQLSLDFTGSRRKPQNFENNLEKNDDGRRGSIFSDNLLNLNPLSLYEIEEEEDGKEQEIRIKFKTRVERDSFVCLIRAIAAIKTMTLAPLLANISKVFDCTISDEKNTSKILEIFDDKYNRVIERSRNIEDSILRLLELNKNKNLENENLIQCAELLESDLQMSITEFKKILDKMDKEGNNREKFGGIEKLEKMEKSLLNVSRNVELIRERSMTPGRRAKLMRKGSIEEASGLESEIEKTDKLNEILIKKIEKLKDENSDRIKSFNVEKGDFKSDNRVSRSVLEGRGKEEEYLLGLRESDDDDENIEGLNEIMDIEKLANFKKKKSKVEEEKSEVREKEQLQKSEENDNEESILEEAINNLECSIMDLEPLEKKQNNEKLSELETQNLHLKEKVKNCKREFEKLIEISKEIQKGKNFHNLFLGFNNLAEHIFEYNGTNIKDLQTVIQLYETKFLKRSLKFNSEKFNDDELLVENKELIEEMKKLKEDVTGIENENKALEGKIGEIEKELGKQKTLLCKEEDEKRKIDELSLKLQMLQEENFRLIEEEII